VSPYELREIQIEVCVDPGELAVARITELQNERPEQFAQWMRNIKSPSVEAYRGSLLDGRAGVVILARVLRSREVTYWDPPGVPEAAEWQSLDVTTELFFVGKSMEECRREQRAGQLLMTFQVPWSPCCDVVPPRELECLLRLPRVTEVPEWVSDAGFDI
jgi:hypothetical protein